MDDDPIAPGNRKLMDYLFEKKEELPNEIYITLSKLIQQKEIHREDTNRYFKIKYSLTETIAIAYRSGDEDDDESINIAMKHRTSNHEAILRKLRSGERVDRSIFDDILDGYADGRMTDSWTGATFVKTEMLGPGKEQHLDPGKITRTMTIISCEEFDPLK